MQPLSRSLIVAYGGLSSTNAQALCSDLYYFAEATVEAWSSKIAWHFYTEISAGSNGNFGGKTGRISDCRVCSLWKIVPVSQTSSYNSKHCQNSLNFSDKTSRCWNALSRFQWLFLWILNALIIDEFVTTGYLVFWTTVPCPWAEIFIVCRGLEHSSTAKTKHFNRFAFLNKYRILSSGSNFNFWINYVSNTFCWAFNVCTDNSIFRRTDDWQVLAKKIGYTWLYSDFLVKFHARNRYRTNCEVKRESEARKQWLPNFSFNRKYFYTQIKFRYQLNFQCSSYSKEQRALVKRYM